MSYSKVRDLRLASTDDGDSGPMPCQRCRVLTLRATLGQYGAMCLSCYERYVREHHPSPVWIADKRTEGPKAWAYSLKAREEGGERVSSVQRTMWRAALPVRTIALVEEEAT